MTEYLEAIGRKLIRFTNDDVGYNIHAVAQSINDTCKELKGKLKELQDVPSP